jgi:hypothetical protein
MTAPKTPKTWKDYIIDSDPEPQAYTRLVPETYPPNLPPPDPIFEDLDPPEYTVWKAQLALDNQAIKEATTLHTAWRDRAKQRHAAATTAWNNRNRKPKPETTPTPKPAPTATTKPVQANRGTTSTKLPHGRKPSPTSMEKQTISLPAAQMDYLRLKGSISGYIRQLIAQDMVQATPVLTASDTATIMQLVEALRQNKQ